MSIGSVNSSYQSSYIMDLTRTAKSSDEDKVEGSSTGSSENKASVPIVAPPSFWSEGTSTGGTNTETETTDKLLNPNFEYLSYLSTSAAKDLGKSSITFKDLLTHRDELTEAFTSKMEAGLKAAGVSEDADFRISLTETGEIEVKSNHPDKAKIEKYFAENPGLANDYQEIEALNKLEQTRKTQSYDMQSIYTQGRALSMSSQMMRQPPTNMAVTGGGSLASILHGGGINTSV